jgi:hypothetical protein
MVLGGLRTDTMSQRHSPTRLSTRPDEYRQTPAGLLGYLAVLAVGLALLTAPVVVGAGLVAAGLAAVAVHLARTVARPRTSGRATGAGADAEPAVDPDAHVAD